MSKRKNNLYKTYLIPILLICVWVGLTTFQILFNDGSPTVIKNTFKAKQFQNISTEPILKGDKRIFEFTATQNNLGIVNINFNTFDRQNEDYIVFRIKEEGSKKWYVEDKFYTKAFTSLNFYPLGFPLISDSKGKNYIIESESLEGTPKTAVAINDSKYILSASYQFDKSKFKNDFPYLLEYLFNKAENSLQYNYLLFTTSVYLFPLIFYFIWLYAERHFKKKSLIHNPIVALLGIAVLFDIFFIDGGFDLVFLTVSILWGGMLFYLKKESKESYKVALGLLILCPILQVLGQDVMVEKAAAWAFLALTVGVIMNVIELRKYP